MQKLQTPLADRGPDCLASGNLVLPALSRLHHVMCVMQLLGIKASMSAINNMIVEAGADESGEVGYDAFVAMMEPILFVHDMGLSHVQATQHAVKSQSAVSFETSINEYRRLALLSPSTRIRLLSAQKAESTCPLRSLLCSLG